MFGDFLSGLRLRTLGIIIAIVTVCLYAPFLSHPFVSLDDDYLIYNNPDVKEMTSQTIKHVFTSYDPQLYIPLTFVSFQVDTKLFGMSPLAFHLTNLLLHIGNALLILWIIRRLTGKNFIAFFTAFFFAIHPLQTEAVLWASARKDTLAGFFFLLSIAFYLRYREQNYSRRYWGSVAAFFLGLLSKVSIIPLPFVLLLIDWWEEKKITKHMLLEKIPYLLLCALFGVIAIIGKATLFASASGSAVIALIPGKSTLFYLWKIFVPVGFSVIYPQSADFSTGMISLIAGALALIGSGFFLFYAFIKGKNRIAAFAVAWYLLLLLPSFSTSWKNGFLYFASDRYAYLAATGIFFLVAWRLDELNSKTNRSYGTAVAIAFSIALIPLTLLQSRTWASSAEMYRTVLRQYPDSVMALNNLGMELDRQEKTAEANDLYRKAIAAEPNNTLAYFNLAAHAGKAGNIDEAVGHYRKAIDVLAPEELTSRKEFTRFFWLADKMDDLGQEADATTLLKKLIAFAPSNGDAHGRLGFHLDRHGHAEEAIKELEEALRLGTNDVRSLSVLGKILAEKGDLAKARIVFTRILSIDPDNEEARQYLSEIQRRVP